MFTREVVYAVIPPGESSFTHTCKLGMYTKHPVAITLSKLLFTHNNEPSYRQVMLKTNVNDGEMPVAIFPDIRMYTSDYTESVKFVQHTNRLIFTLSHDSKPFVSACPMEISFTLTYSS